MITYVGLRMNVRSTAVQLNPAGAPHLEVWIIPPWPWPMTRVSYQCAGAVETDVCMEAFDEGYGLNNCEPVGG